MIKGIWSRLSNGQTSWKLEKAAERADAVWNLHHNTPDFCHSRNLFLAWRKLPAHADPFGLLRILELDHGLFDYEIIWSRCWREIEFFHPTCWLCWTSKMSLAIQAFTTLFKKWLLTQFFKEDPRWRCLRDGSSSLHNYIWPAFLHEVVSMFTGNT